MHPFETCLSKVWNGHFEREQLLGDLPAIPAREREVLKKKNPSDLPLEYLGINDRFHLALKQLGKLESMVKTKEILNLLYQDRVLETPCLITAWLSALAFYREYWQSGNSKAFHMCLHYLDECRSFKTHQLPFTLLEVQLNVIAMREERAINLLIKMSRKPETAHQITGLLVKYFSRIGKPNIAKFYANRSKKFRPFSRDKNHAIVAA